MTSQWWKNLNWDQQKGAALDPKHGLNPRQIAQNQAWYAAAEQYGADLNFYQAQLDVLDETAQDAMMPRKPQPFWSAGRRPVNPPHLPRPPAKELRCTLSVGLPVALISAVQVQALANGERLEDYVERLLRAVVAEGDALPTQTWTGTRATLQLRLSPVAMAKAEAKFPEEKVRKIVELALCVVHPAP